LRADSTWQRWSPVPGHTTALGAWITAVPRTTDHLDLFATDDGAAIFSTPLPYEWELFPPQPPTGLHVTEVGDRKLGVAWKDRSDNEDGFIIRYRGEGQFGDDTGSLSVRKNTQAAALAGLRSGFEYTIHVVAVNAAGESGGPSVTATTPARTINVAKEGVGQSTVFVVKGTGFSPNSKVFLQITHGLSTLSEWVETAEGDGTLTSRHSYSCVTGQELTFSAYETADPVGTRSNYLDTSCP
jgi:hypothetical protein